MHKLDDEEISLLTNIKYHLALPKYDFKATSSIDALVKGKKSNYCIWLQNDKIYLTLKVIEDNEVYHHYGIGALPASKAFASDLYDIINSSSLAQLQEIEKILIFATSASGDINIAQLVNQKSDDYDKEVIKHYKELRPYKTLIKKIPKNVDTNYTIVDSSLANIKNNTYFLWLQKDKENVSIGINRCILSFKEMNGLGNALWYDYTPQKLFLILNGAMCLANKNGLAYEKN